MYICTPWICGGGDECEAGSLSFPIHAYQHTYVRIYEFNYFFCPLVFVYMTAVCVYMYRQIDRLSGWSSEIVPAHILAHVDD